MDHNYKVWSREVRF